jgi:hypothetical protein
VEERKRKKEKEESELLFRRQLHDVVIATL